MHVEGEQMSNFRSREIKGRFRVILSNRISDLFLSVSHQVEMFHTHISRQTIEYWLINVFQASDWLNICLCHKWHLQDDGNIDF